VGFLPGGCNSLDRKDKQAHLAMPVAPACLRPSKKQASSFLPGGPCFLDRKDKQAGPMRLFIVFSRPKKQASQPLHYKQIPRVTAM